MVGSFSKRVSWTKLWEKNQKCTQLNARKLEEKMVLWKFDKSKLYQEIAC